jgi:hypothetical protein
MFKLLGLIFMFFIFIVVFGLMFVGNILKAFFSTGHHNKPSGQSQQETDKPAQKKVFEEDDGEYVDFEEIKDDQK